MAYKFLHSFLLASLCLLLRWGAMDAEAYPEPASEILKILWVVGTSRNHGQGSLWATARATAFIALAHYEVDSMTVWIHLSRLFLLN